jgi:hypothetical protein
MTIKVRFFGDFGDINSKVFELMYNRSDKDIEFVNDNSYTHVVIINKAMPNISHIPIENVIGVAAEPNEFLGLNDTFIEYAKNNISRYFIGSKNDLPAPFEEHYLFPSHNWANTKFLSYEEKPKLMSLMISQKAFLPGHVYRYALAEKIITQDIPVDILGRGADILKHYYPDSKHIKSAFQLDSELYKDYKYSIVIENTTSNTYSSEKLNNAYVYNTIPIYIGANQVEEMIGKNCCIKLSGDLNQDVELIKNIALNPDKYKINLESFRKNLYEGDCCWFTLMKKLWLS